MQWEIESFLQTELSTLLHKSNLSWTLATGSIQKLQLEIFKRSGSMYLTSHISAFTLQFLELPAHISEKIWRRVFFFFWCFPETGKVSTFYLYRLSLFFSYCFSNNAIVHEQALIKFGTDRFYSVVKCKMSTKCTRSSITLLSFKRVKTTSFHGLQRRFSHL